MESKQSMYNLLKILRTVEEKYKKPCAEHRESNSSSK